MKILPKYLFLTILLLQSTFVVAQNQVVVIPLGSNKTITIENFTGKWTPETAYDEGETVQIDGSTYVCVVAHSSSHTFDTNKWSLLAAKGNQGDTGPQGVQGIQGDIGPQGLRGVIGPQGPQGNQGNIGPVGQQGIQGSPGTDGADGESGLTVAVMYLRRNKNLGAPNTCPVTWNQADYQTETVGDDFNYVRTCYTMEASCQVMYLRRNSNVGLLPNTCPTGWTEADFGKTRAGGTGSDNFVRTCYVCN